MTSSCQRMFLRIQTGRTMMPWPLHMRAHSLSHHVVTRLAPVLQTLRMTNQRSLPVSGLHRGRICSFCFPCHNPQPSNRNLAPVDRLHLCPHPLLRNRLHPFPAPRPHLPRHLLVLPTSLGDKEREHMIALHLQRPRGTMQPIRVFPKSCFETKTHERSTVESCNEVSRPASQAFC